MFCSLIANSLLRGGFRTAATSKMELFVIIVNGWKPLTIITKELHLGCCSSPKSACATIRRSKRFKEKNVITDNVSLIDSMKKEVDYLRK